MTAPPLKVRVGVLPEAQPVLEALGRMSVDVGSVAASKFFPTVPPEARFLCVAVADDLGVIDFGRRLRHELRGNDAALTLSNKCLIDRLPLDARLIVFLDILALEG